ncbi:MAG: type II secretion system F family protein [Candidatus Pacebacteria bacterium]|nr:type II secretion system F family protein [Candidatus Paceibacterota bacterium]
MPKYFYKAKNLKGEDIEGYLEVLNEKQLAQNLRSQGYFLISSQSTNNPNQEGNKEGKNKNEKFPGKLKINFLDNLFGVPLTEKLFFVRNLGVMVKTGVSLVRAFEILSQQTRSKMFKNVLTELSGEVNKGESLAEALGHYPKVFPVIFQETIKVGEETGKLENALKTLNKQMEKEHDLKSKIASAMVYPIMVLIMVFGIGIFMMIFAVPKIKASFTEMGVQLPITTKIILGFADLLINHWILVILVVFGFIAGMFFFLKSGKGGKIKSTIWLKIPIISKLVRQTNSALTLRTLSSLLQSGVPIVRALVIASGSLGNFYFRDALKNSAESVERGEKLSKALKAYQNIFSPMIVQMLEVGEETGETPDILEKLAEFLEEEVGASTQRLSSIIEPLLIMCVGGAVGFFAVSMMQPMFSIMEGVK